MIDSITIFSKTGVILYHIDCQLQSKNAKNNEFNININMNTPNANSIHDLNSFLSEYILSHQSFSTTTTQKKKTKRIFLSPKSNNKTSSSSDNLVLQGSNQATTVAEWEETHDDDNDAFDWMAVAIYPKVVLDHSTTSSSTTTSSTTSLGWIRKFLNILLKEYTLFYNASSTTTSSSTTTNNEEKKENDHFIPDATLFNPTFQVLYQQYETLGRERKLIHDDDDNDDDDYEEEEQQEEEEENINTTTKKKKSTKKGKEARVWHDSTHKVTSKSMAALDYSKTTKQSKKGTGSSSTMDDIADEDNNALREARAAYLPSENERPLWEIEAENTLLDDDIDDDDDDDDDNDGNNKGIHTSRTWGTSLKGMLSQISGNKILQAQDLEQPLAEMHKMLTGKNVASDIATEICTSVQERLVGRKLASLTRVKTAVRQALEVTIEKILKPGKDKEVDLLRAVVTKREQGSGGFFRRSGGESEKKKPYVIVMVGINGVGKSTSLAKIAYFLTSNKCKPLLAACDTFRSGAVEQLNVHAKCLNVPLYHKGYAKDPAAVAKSAIEHATEEGNDVVLVDTAGRMQNNAPLMKALSTLVVQNKPDLVLFVCEALVGNDGLDQLRMFDKALRSGGHSRQIDGIILTKYDTVSDKVGAALTLTHLTGAPVVFVGTGQKYNHLMKLSVQSVIKSLFE